MPLLGVLSQSLLLIHRVELKLVDSGSLHFTKYVANPPCGVETPEWCIYNRLSIKVANPPCGVETAK